MRRATGPPFPRPAIDRLSWRSRSSRSVAAVEPGSRAAKHPKGTLPAEAVPDACSGVNSAAVPARPGGQTIPPEQIAPPDTERCTGGVVDLWEAA